MCHLFSGFSTGILFWHQGGGGIPAPNYIFCWHKTKLFPALLLVFKITLGSIPKSKNILTRVKFKEKSVWSRDRV